MASHAASTCASRLMRFGASHAGETANVATKSTAPAFPAYCSLMYERRQFQPMLHPSIHAKRLELGDVARTATDAAVRTEGEFKPGVDMSVECHQRLKTVDAMKCDARHGHRPTSANRSNIGRAVRVAAGPAASAVTWKPPRTNRKLTFSREPRDHRRDGTLRQSSTDRNFAATQERHRFAEAGRDHRPGRAPISQIRIGKLVEKHGGASSEDCCARSVASGSCSWRSVIR